ncbi:MAG TPA: Vms1/Ankzf1 family peptidyl-tRNA hydrolase [Gemmatimonadales bacterium]|nr:Vms1/Ankzf1 family peptidyl-tRNA hydrolase [Gemmatimonadales bacterium]
MSLLLERLHHLAALPPSDLPVISLYLNTQANQHGRDEYERWLDKALTERAAELPERGPARDSFDADVTKIRAWLSEELEPSTNGVAIFASSGAGLFEAIQLQAPVDDHRLHIQDQPHLFHLARIHDAYPRFAIVQLDTNSAQIVVAALGRVELEHGIEGQKTNRSEAGGWSQARFQRRADNLYQQHAREVVDALDVIVREEGIRHVVLIGDEVIIPRLREELPKHLEEKVIGVLRLDSSATNDEIVAASLAAMRAADAAADEAKVEAVLDGWRSGGLGVAGIEETLAALTRGQVAELVLTARFEADHAEPEAVDGSVLPEVPSGRGRRTQTVDLPAQAVLQALATGATVTFIENESALDEACGVGAILRFSLQAA